MDSRDRKPGQRKLFRRRFWPFLGLSAIALSGFGDRSWAECTPANTGTPGADHITCDADNDAEGADVESFAGDDVLDLDGGTIGSVFAGSGNDTINLIVEEEDNIPDVDETNYDELEEEDFTDIGGITDNAVVIENIIDAGSGNDTVILNNRKADIGDFMNGGGIDAGSGNDTIELLDGLAFYIWGGSGDDNITLDGAYVYNYIDAGDGDDTIYWDEGVTNEVRGGPGSDTVRIDAYAYESGALLDGGDDLHAGDGQVDTLTFLLDFKQDGRLLRNWERIVIWGSSKMEFFGSLNVGGGVDADGNDLGLDILFGGLVQFIPQRFVVTGNIANAGTLDLAHNNRFDRLILRRDADGNYGSYIGNGGRLWLDTRLYDDGSPTDLVTIGGDTSGRTSVRITNRGGRGAVTTGDGIRIVEVQGNSAANAFVLDGDFVSRDGQPATVGGAYAYTLHHNGITDPADGDWYLRSVFTNSEYFPGEGSMPRWQPGAVMYESYPQILRSLNQPDTLRQRVGNRFWVGSSYKDVGVCDYADSVEKTIDGGGAWMRVVAERREMESEESTTRANWTQDFYKLQLGVDAPLNFTVRGTQPIASVALHYGDSDTDVESFFGDGDIDVEYYGAASYLTWYGIDGSYLDTQLHLNWFNSEIEPDDLRRLSGRNDAFGYALSVEGGRSFKLGGHCNITPQAQLSYSSEEADDIRDVYGTKLTDVNNNGFRARIGATFDNRVTQRKAKQPMFGSQLLERFTVYVTPSAIYNIRDQTDVRVSGTRLIQDRDDWRGELSIGATYDECGDYCSVYGELKLSSSLENFGKSNSGGLYFGFRFKW